MTKHNSVRKTRKPYTINEKTSNNIPKIPNQGRIALILRERMNFWVDELY